MSDNPYASPHGEEDGFRNPLVEETGSRNPLIVPACCLLVLGILYLLLQLISLPRQFASMAAVDTSTPRGQGEFAGILTFVIMSLVATIGVVIGSVSMLRLRGYRSARAGAILSMIPFCSPCFVFGIPFGIWALVILLRPDVKRLFD